MSLSWIQLPDGYTFALENQRSIEVQGVNLVLTDNGGKSRSIPFDNVSQALFVQAAVQVVMVTPANFTSLIKNLVFTSITPNTATVGVNYPSLVVAGTGFLSESTMMNLAKFDDGAGHIIYSWNGIISDSEFDLNATFAVAGVYTVYYSGDGGTTWTTTGLTITAS